MGAQIALGMVGLGTIARTQLRALEQLHDFKLVAGADLNPDLAPTLPDGATFYNHYEHLLLDHDVSAVLISTPLSSHFEIAVAALLSGKHVLLEKPATADLSHFERLVDTASRAQGKLVVAFHAAFAEDLIWFLDQFPRSKETHGDITHIHSGFFDPYLNQQEPFSSLGGSWLDSGVNALSVIARLVDLSGSRVEDALLGHVANYGGEVHASVRVRYPTDEGAWGGTAVIDTSWAVGLNRKQTHIRFAKTRDEIVLDHTNQKVIRVRPTGERSTLFAASDERLVNHYRGVFKDFQTRIATNTDNLALAKPIHWLLFQAANRIA